MKASKGFLKALLFVIGLAFGCATSLQLRIAASSNASGVGFSALSAAE